MRGAQHPIGASVRPFRHAVTIGAPAALHRRRSCFLPRLSGLLLGLLVAGPAFARQGGRPVLATEDSLRQFTLPDTVLVRSPRVPLLDIIRKAQEGEKHKFDGVNTMAYTRVVKVLIEYGSPKPRTEVEEEVTRVYYQAPDRWREVQLRKNEFVIEKDGTRHPKDEDKGGVNVEVGEEEESGAGDGGRTLSRLPDYLERLDRYDFQILHRSLRPDQVVYEIGFQPKSDFEILPNGRMWILTRGYQIVREELHFQRLPMPGILKSVDLVTREWQEVDGRWVEKRITARAEMGLPKIFRAPQAFEIGVMFDDYVFNPTLDPALFGEKK